MKTSMKRKSTAREEKPPEVTQTATVQSPRKTRRNVARNGSILAGVAAVIMATAKLMHPDTNPNATHQQPAAVEQSSKDDKRDKKDKKDDQSKGDQFNINVDKNTGVIVNKDDGTVNIQNGH
jgi:hypothetical protein